MKKILLFFFVLVIFAACKKDSDVTPADPVTTVSGTYEINKLQQGTQIFVLPITAGNQTVSATLTAAPTTAANTVSLSVTIRQTGVPDNTETLGEVEVRGSGTNLELYEGTSKVGTADGKNLTIDATQDTGERIVIVAVRK